MPVPGSDRNPDIDAVFTMCAPSPCSSIRGTKVWMPLTTPPRLTESCQSQSSYVALCIGPNWLTPAVLQSSWTGPNVRSASSAAARIRRAIGDVEANRMHLRARAASGNTSSRRRDGPRGCPAITTFMPAAANTFACPSATPLPPPVMNATLPDRSFMRVSFPSSSCIVGATANTRLGRVARAGRHPPAVDLRVDARRQSHDRERTFVEMQRVEHEQVVACLRASGSRRRSGNRRPRPRALVARHEAAFLHARVRPGEVRRRATSRA